MATARERAEAALGIRDPLDPGKPDQEMEGAPDTRRWIRVPLGRPAAASDLDPDGQGRHPHRDRFESLELFDRVAAIRRRRTRMVRPRAFTTPERTA